MTAKDIDQLYNSTRGCKNCGQKFYPGCLDGSSPDSDMICRACIIYITNFDPNNKFIALAFKALNNMSTVNQTDDVYGPNDKKPLLTELASIDHYLKPSPRPADTLKPALQGSKGIVSGDNDVEEEDEDDDGDKDDETSEKDPADEDARRAHRPPTAVQVEPVELNEPIGKHAQYFEEIGAKKLTKEQMDAPLFVKPGFVFPVTVTINNVLRTYKPIYDTKRHKPSKFIRFYIQEGLTYNKLNKFDVYDGYANTVDNLHTSIYGPCVISNPHTHYKFVYICLWRGQCGRIVKHFLYDLQKREIVTLEGTAFYRHYWNFSPEIPFDEDEVKEAYSVVTASKEYDPSRDTTSIYGNPEIVILDNISGDGTGKPSRLRRPASLFGKEKDPIEVSSAPKIK